MNMGIMIAIAMPYLLNLMRRLIDHALLNICLLINRIHAVTCTYVSNAKTRKILGIEGNIGA